MINREADSQGGKIDNNLLRIFMAEDSLVNQTIAKHFINKLGHLLTIAKDGVEAEELLSRSEFDIIFMDIRMPFKNGYEVTKDLRQNAGPNSKSTIIALTADALSGVEEKCLTAGMDDYITKPISLSELERILNKWANRAEINPRQ